MSQSDINALMRRRRRADARFRGEPMPEDDEETLSPGELVVGGALVGLALLALFAALGLLAAGDRVVRRDNRR